MSRSSARQSTPLWLLGAVVLIAVAAVAFVVFRVAGVGPDATSAPAPQNFTPLGEYAERAPHVDSVLNVIGIQGSVRGAAATPAPELPPVSPSAFKRPIAEYLAYGVRQLGAMEGDVAKLRAALASGDRTASEAAWRTAWARYLRLGGVYLEGSLAALNQAIDGTPGGLAGGPSNPHFVGLHRIEYGLWTGAAPGALVPYADGLMTNVAQMKALLPHTTISPLEYVTRAHEILEDAVRDLLSGTDVPWSDDGVLGTQAGLVATRELISTMSPLLVEPASMQADPPSNPRSPALVDADLNTLQSVLDALAEARGGQLPSNQQLTQPQTERLDAAIGQALEGLAQLPGLLETTNPPAIPAIPRSGFKLDR